MDRRGFLLAAGCFVAACKREEQPPKATAPAAPVERPAPPVPVDPRPAIVAFGDSLTAGHGVATGLSYPDFLQKELDLRGYRYHVVNQGISGDTTSGGAARTGEALRVKPAVVILELGANDGLRGLPLLTTRANLYEMADAFLKSGARVLLAGMTLPRNYGQDYIRGFEAIFQDLARERKLVLIPFLLDGVAMNPKLMQGDALHPNAEGNKKVAATVMRYLEPLLEREKRGKQGRK